MLLALHPETLVAISVEAGVLLIICRPLHGRVGLNFGLGVITYILALSC